MRRRGAAGGESLLEAPALATLHCMAEIATVDVLPPGEKLTLDEVLQRHPDEWVALTDTEVVDMQLLAGVVYAHHPDRDTMRNLARQADAILILHRHMSVSVSVSVSVSAFSRHPLVGIDRTRSGTSILLR